MRNEQYSRYSRNMCAEWTHGMEQRWQRRSTDTGRVETMREGNYLSAVRDLRARLRCTQRSPLLPKMTSPVNQRASKLMTIPMLFFMQGPTSLEKLARINKDTDGPNVLKRVDAWRSHDSGRHGGGARGAQLDVSAFGLMSGRARAYFDAVNRS